MKTKEIKIEKRNENSKKRQYKIEEVIKETV